tara:strand:+ start:6520 stop:7260 length:741 start_codon:yes stop_codon:yes gene_type:complete
MQDKSDQTNPDVKIQRFVDAINHALVSNSWTQRRLCEELGVTIGTMTKYLRGAVHPDRVGFEIQCRLAKALGFTPQALHAYYQTGEYITDVTFEQVVAFCQSQITNSEIPVLLSAVSKQMSEGKPHSHSAKVEIVHTDDDAEVMREGILGAFQELMKTKELSWRRAWSVFEGAIKAKGLDEEEIEGVYTMLHQPDTFNGEVMTMMHRRIADRFVDECPGVKTFRELGVVYEPLEECNRRYCQANAA